MPLPGASRGESQNDVFALVRVNGNTLAMAIEGKVDEPFAEPLGEWLQNASDGKRERLGFICELLGLKLPLADHIHCCTVPLPRSSRHDALKRMPP